MQTKRNRISIPRPLIIWAAAALLGGRVGVTQAAQDVTVNNPPTNPVNVEVTNTPLPVTTTGTTRVTGSVGITGTPTVNLAHGATVQIASPTVFRGALSNTSPITNSTSNLLVIDLVSGVVGAPTPGAGAALLFITDSSDPEPPSYFIPGTIQAGTSNVIVHALTKIYVKPGETLNLNNLTTLQLSGHYEP